MTAKSKNTRIEQILDSLKNAAAGNYSKKLDFASKDDDLGLIANAVNKLLKKIEKKFLSAGQAPADFAENARRYRHILDNIEESYFEVDLKGHLNFFNDTVIRDLGYPPEELKGIHFSRLVDETNAKKVYEAFHQVFLTGIPVKGFDWEIQKKDKGIIYVESSAALMRNKTGKPVGFRGIVRDVSERVLARKNLRQSENKYHAILDIMDEGYTEHDLAGQITFANDAACRLMGIDRDRLIGMHYREHLTKATAQKLKAVYQGIYQTGQPIMLADYDVAQSNGTTLTYEISAALRYDDSGKPCGFRTLLRNVTARKKAEEDKRLSEEKYRTILEIMEEGYFESDFHGIITFANDAGCKLVGLQREELIGKKYDRYINPETQKRVNDVYRQTFSSGRPSHRIEYSVTHKDGSVRFHQQHVTLSRDESGRPTGFRALARDVTSRRQAEERQQLSEQKYRHILENMEDTYLETDLKGNFLFFNDSLCRVLGYSREELQSTSYKLVTPPDIQQRVFDSFNEIYRTGKTKNFYGHKLIKKDGSIIYLDMSIALLRSNDGTPTGFGGFGRDVTERVKAGQKIEENEKHLRLITNNIRDVIWTLDFDLNYTYMSPSVYELTGFTIKEVLSMPLKAIIPPHIFQDITNRLAHELAREATGDTHIDPSVSTFELQMMHKTGKPIWVEIRANFTRDENGKPIEIVGVTRDITEQKKNQNALVESEELYRRALETTNDGVTIIQNGHYVYFNEKFLKTLGIPKGTQVGGEPLGAMLHPDDRKKIKDAYLAHMQGKATPGKHDVRVIRPDGKLLYLQVTSVDTIYNGKPSILSFMQDITERKQAEDALRESEKRYRMIVENMHDSISILDLNFQFLYQSPSEIRVTGFTPEELMRIPIRDQMTPESYSLAELTLARELELEASGKPVNPHRIIYMELEVYHKNGGAIWEEVNATFQRDENGHPIGMILTSRDITARKKAETALIENERRYRTMAENVNDVIWTLDMNMQFTYVSPSSATVTGYTPEEAKQTSLSQLLTPESLTSATQKLADELALERSGKPFDPNRAITLEIEAIHKDGSLLYMEITGTFYRNPKGEITEILILGRNFTQRKKAEQALQESEQRYRMIIENMHEVIWTTDLKMQNNYMSPSCFYLTGYTPEEIMAIPLDQLLTPESLALAVNTIAEELARENGTEPIDPHRSRTMEQEIRCKNDGTIWMEVTGTFIRDEEGKATGMLMAGRDITARKKAEEEKDKLEVQLMQAQKMETVGRLAGGVAHDFNNMLSVILGYADLAKMRLAKQHPVLKDIMEIEKAAIRSRDITAQLLAFSRKQIIEPKIIDLNSLIVHTEKALIRLIGEDVELKVLQGEKLWPVKFDPSQIEQILINLAVNARDAMPTGGKLTIETVNIVLDDLYCKNHVGFTPGEYVRLSFSDNGVGMEKTTLQYIFEPFFTTKEVGKGTGLGLATVYGIVKQNKGFINVYSEPGRGTAFSIYLPRTFSEEEVQQAPKEEPEITGTGSILLVEDDAMVLQITKGMLESIGYEVTSFSNPLEVISLLKNSAVSFDLIITDVVMPGMSGKDLRDRLLEMRPDIKVLFMSGYTADVIAHHGVLEEGVQFLQKPFTIKSLAGKVRESMARSS